MKKQLFSVMLLAATVAVKGQSTYTSTIENVALTSEHNMIYNDSTGGDGFASGAAFFPSEYDQSFGGYWASGWAASAVHDSSTAGYSNMYGCAAYKGYNNSNTFAVGSAFGDLHLLLADSLTGKTAQGFYVCNSTYAYKSMKNGDSFEPAFSTANNDYFKLTVKTYHAGILTNDSVEVYLADYRSTNPQPYILKTWQWVNTATLGASDSLAFFLYGSQTGSFGLNTPAYFCLDNFTVSYTGHTTGINKNADENMLSVYPNPSVGETEIAFNLKKAGNLTLKVYDMLSKEVLSQPAQAFAGLNKFKVDVSAYPAGIYYINVRAGEETFTTKLIKQ